MAAGWPEQAGPAAAEHAEEVTRDWPALRWVAHRSADLLARSVHEYHPTTMSYARPGFFTARVLNPMLSLLAGRLGLNFRGAQVLSVQGRKSGEWRSIPVNPLRHAAQRYLVAPRGETEWVRNLRVSHTARLTFAGKTELVRVEEVADRDKAPILRAYLQQWALETARFFHGARADSADAELARVAPQHPVFRILS